MSWNRIAGIFAIALAVNLAAVILLHRAQSFDLFSNDGGTMLLDYLLLLPLVLLQPWCVTFIGLRYCEVAIWQCLLVNVAVTTLVYALIDQHWLDEVCYRLRWRLLCPYGIVFILAFLFSYFPCLDFSPADQAQPSAVAKFVATDINVQYSIEYPPYLQCVEWLGRGTVDRSGVDQLCRNLNLTAAKVSKVFYGSSADDGHVPYWWKPVISDSLEAYDNRDQGGRSCVRFLWDRQTEIFYAEIIESY